MPTIKAISVVVAVIAAAPAGAAAQVIKAIEWESQPAMMAPDGVVKGCGFRFYGAVIPDGMQPWMDAESVDGSLMAYADGMGSVKAGLGTMRFASGSWSVATTTAKVRWLRVDGQQAMAPTDGMVVESSDQGFMLYTTTFAKALPSLADAIDGKSLKIAFTRDDDRMTIFSGKIKPNATTKREFGACIEEMAEQVNEARGGRGAR